jgi:methanogenic corrinoid protein MtbC1
MAEVGQQMFDSTWLPEQPYVGSAEPAPSDAPPPPSWPEAPFGVGTRVRPLGLVRAVELDVVPRLVLARRGLADPAAFEPAGPSIEEFAQLILGNDVPLAMAYADRARARGMSLESLYLKLLAPTARHLGELWNEDLVDFTQVTIGLGRLHRVMRDLTASSQSGMLQPHDDHRVLLVPAPGEQHTFGLAMVAEFFRRAAWIVWSGAPSTTTDLAGIVHDNWFAVVGFSLGSEARLEGLRAGIRRVRRASQNPAIGILVGGPLFIEHPELVAQVGADATAADGLQAVGQAQSLLTLLPTRV